MYHGHLDDQVGAGLYGKLIVYEPPWAPLPYKYDAELSVILNDWWHRSVTEQVGTPPYRQVVHRRAALCDLEFGGSEGLRTWGLVLWSTKHSLREWGLGNFPSPAW